MDNFLATKADDNDDVSTTTKPKKPLVSKVWTFFTRGTDGTARCNICSKSYRTSGNKSNLKNHLKRMHPDHTFSEIPVPTFESAKTYEEALNRKCSIDMAGAKMIATDLQPTSIVENEGFINLIKIIDPEYKLPSRYEIRDIYLKNMHLSMIAKLQDILCKIEYCAITTDGWTSKANTNYLTITCHFISDFELKSVVLSTMPLLNEHNHTGQNIAQTLKLALNEWNIFNKVVAIVTDNAATMLNACKLLKKRHLECFAHTLNLVVQDALSLSLVKSALGKCKTIVTYFKSSATAYAELKTAQGNNPHGLIQEVPNRWNSAFYMLKRFLLLKNEISSVLLNTSEQMLNADEINVLTDICELLKMFDDATHYVSGDTQVTISLIIPVACGLYLNLEKITTKLQTTEGLEVCELLKKGVEARLFQFETRTVTRIATMLDPRFKKEAFRSPFNAAEAMQALEDELPISPTIKVEPEEQSQTEVDGLSLLGYVQEKCQTKIKNRRVDSILALREYTEKPNSKQSLDPLTYWKTNFLEYPSLAEVVKRYLCIPASSAESERMFSKAGEIVSNRRSLLNEEDINILVFVNKNKWLYEEAI